MKTNQTEKELLSNLRAIGNNVASLWGAECISWEVDQKAKVVVFACIEHGEEFETDIAFGDLAQYSN